MKTIKYIFFILAALIVIYIVAIFAGFNLPRPTFFEDKGIVGETTLKVTLLMDNNAKNPLSNIEVDVAPNPGPPPKGGIAYTNDSGVAIFNIRPGNYFVYFNTINFPKNLNVPREQAITVTAGTVNEKIILINTK